MEFHTIQSLKDEYFDKAVEFYNQQLDINFYENSALVKQSLQNNKTENDYAIVIGTEKNEVVSLALAHYEATTNSAFLVHLMVAPSSDYDELFVHTLEKIEDQLNKLAQKVHSRDINFMMIEVPKEHSTEVEFDEEKLAHRQQLLLDNGFEKQSEINYLHPNYTKDEEPFEVDLFIKSNIELTKDIYPASVKSNYILKYVFANGISREIIYPLLERMNLRLPL
ncbi:hypothetical protein FH144_08670 [Staphylococcus caledonicus]|uniref:hypothetical protein n=1 Tax=Staphylococcus sp. acrmy TaxID=2929076 RepID=UPI001F5A01E1|nr:hypothetical protein [Staphylococcus sp. acrmy]